MITEQTAEAIIKHKRKLASAEYRLKNIKGSKARLEVTIRREGNKYVDTTDEFNIDQEHLGQILRDIITSHKAQLDKLNKRAIQEAQIKRAHIFDRPKQKSYWGE
jgi:hypothetical protein